MDVKGARSAGGDQLLVIGDRPAAPGSAQAAAIVASGPVLAIGKAVGSGVVTGMARFIPSLEALKTLRPGEILLAETTTPEWEPAMRTAAAIVTNLGDLDSHAAKAARAFSLTAVVGTLDGASRLWTGAPLVVACDEGEVGRVYGAPPRSPQPRWD